MNKDVLNTINEPDSPSDASTIQPRINTWRHFFRVFFSRWVVIIGMVIIVVFILTAIFAPWIAPYNPYQQNLGEALAPPSSHHLLGTDGIGRDTLSRIIYGTRTAIMIGVIALGIAAVVGMVLGMLAGFYGGWVYTIIMRFIDALMAFPMILLALVIAGMLGGGLLNVMIALGVSMVPGYARLMCGQVLSVKENDYILAARSLGSGSWRVIFRHIFPNCFPPLIVLITMMIGMVILAEAGLAFLGIGIQPPAADWGGMVNSGYPYLKTDPILSIAPGLAIMLVVFAFNMVGDGLRDALDPMLRGTI